MKIYFTFRSFEKRKCEFHAKIKTDPLTSNGFYKTWENATVRRMLFSNVDLLFNYYLTDHFN